MVLLIALSVGMIGLDQLFKYLAVVYLRPVGVAPLLPGVIQLRYIENDGAAFSILAGRQPLLIVITGIALLVVGYIVFVKRPKDKLELYALLLVFAGGVGNLIDRVRVGYVVDYFDLQFMNFAVFNLADCFVCVGFALLVIALIRAEVQARKGKPVPTAPAKEDADGQN